MEETMEVDAAMYTTYPDTQDRSRDNQSASSEDPFVPGKHLNSLESLSLNLVFMFTLPETCSNVVAGVCSAAARQFPRNTSQGSYT